MSMEDYLVDTIEMGKYVAKIYIDSDPIDPRDDDNLGTMVCLNRKYNLGDKHDYRSEDYSGWDDIEQAITKDCNGKLIILPLYLYDHSGITINTTGFSCPWDSGQVGFVYVSDADIRKDYSVKRITKKTRELAKSVLISEVAVYSQYIEGDVYGYVIETKDGDEIDSCWGFFGIDYMEQEVNRILAYYIEEDKHNANSIPCFG